MKIKDGYIIKKVMNRYMIVSTDDSAVHNMQTLNETGAFLWNLLTEETTIDKMCLSLTAEYDIDADTAKKDIEKFVSSLDAASLLEK